MNDNTKYIVIVVVLLVIWYAIYRMAAYNECAAYWQGLFGNDARIWIRQYC